MDKNKIMIAVAAALGVAAIGFVAYTHASTANAQATADPGTSGSLPSLLYATGGSSTPTLPTSQSTSLDTVSGTGTNATPAPSSSDNAILASLQGLVSQVTASANVAYNATASDLFKSLPASLAANNIDTFSATQSQSADGQTSLITSATYHPAPPPVPVAAAPVADTSPHFWWQGSDYTSAANFTSQNLANYTRITGHGPGQDIYGQLAQDVAIGMTDPRNRG